MYVNSSIFNVNLIDLCFRELSYMTAFCGDGVVWSDLLISIDSKRDGEWGGGGKMTFEDIELFLLTFYDHN